MATPYRRDTFQRLTDKDDHFAHRDYAAALVEAIQQVPSPFTLGLFAPWGSGKSSILYEVGERLQKQKDAAWVYFDVWRYEGDSLRREFIRDVATQLMDQKLLGWGFRARRPHRTFRRRHRSNLTTPAVFRQSEPYPRVCPGLVGSASDLGDLANRNLARIVRQERTDARTNCKRGDSHLRADRV